MEANVPLLFEQIKRLEEQKEAAEAIATLSRRVVELETLLAEETNKDIRLQQQRFHIEELEDTLRECSEQAGSLAAKVAHLRGDLSEMQEMRDHALDENARLRKHLEEEHADEKSFVAMRDEIARLRLMRDYAEKALEEAGETIARLRGQVEELLAALGDHLHCNSPDCPGDDCDGCGCHCHPVRAAIEGVDRKREQVEESHLIAEDVPPPPRGKR